MAFTNSNFLYKMLHSSNYYITCQNLCTQIFFIAFIYKLQIREILYIDSPFPVTGNTSWLAGINDSNIILKQILVLQMLYKCSFIQLVMAWFIDKDFHEISQPKIDSTDVYKRNSGAFLFQIVITSCNLSYSKWSGMK